MKEGEWKEEKLWGNNRGNKGAKKWMRERGMKGWIKGVNETRKNGKEKGSKSEKLGRMTNEWEGGEMRRK